MAFLDAYLLPLLVGLPLCGVLFLAVMPATDRIALRHAGLGAAIVTGLVGLRAAWVALTSPVVESSLRLSTSWGGLVPGGVALSLDVTRAPLLLALVVMAPMTLRAGAPRIVERTKGYVLLNLLFLGLAIAALLSEHALVALALLDASLLPLLLLLGLFGGPFKGSVALRVGMSWLLVDAVAFAALAWLVARAPGGDAPAVVEAARALSPDERLVVFAPVALAAALRLAVAPACAWFVSFLREAPLAAAALAVAGVMPLGGWWFFHFGVALFPDAAVRALPVLVVVGAATCLLGGCLAFVERDLRLVVAGAGMLYGGVAFVGVASLEPGAVSAALLLLSLGGATLAFLLYAVDALERRYVTRDSTELFGVFEELPSLWRIVLLAFVATVGFPLLGGGSLLLPLVIGLFGAPAVRASGLEESATLVVALAVAAGFTLYAAAVVVVVRRLSSPHFRHDARAKSSFSSWQALRLWIPAVLVVAGGMLAPRMAERLEQVIAARLPEVNAPPDEAAR